MRIGIDCQAIKNPEGGDVGIAHYTYYLVKNLINIDDDNQYFLFFGQPLTTKAFIKSNVKIKYYPGYKFKKYLPFVYSHVFIPLYMKLHFVKMAFFPANTMPYFFWGRAVLTVHDLSFLIEPAWFEKISWFFKEKLLPKSLKKAEKIIVPSEAVKKNLKHLFNLNEKVAVIAEGFDYQEYNQIDLKKKFGLSDPFFLFIGTIEPRKNLALLVKAFSGVCRQYPQYKLVIAGKKGSDYQKILQIIYRYQLEDKVILTGYISWDEKISLYQKAFAFVYPSFYEGFGLPVLEAMSFGLPVITSQESSMAEFSDEAALLIKPDSVEDLQNALLKILKNHSLRQGMISIGFKKSRNYSWRFTAQKTLEVFESLK